MFEHYSNPRKAMQVWQEYYPEIQKRPVEVIDRAEIIAEECQTADDLDFRLDRLVGVRPLHFFDDDYHLNSPEEDPDGFSSRWSTAVRNYEESVA